MQVNSSGRKNKLSKFDLWIIRIFISSVCLTQKVLQIITLIHLFQDMQYLNFTFLLLNHLFVIMFSLLNVLLNFYDQIKISRMQRLMWEFLYFLPDSDIQDKMIMDNSACIIIKLVFDVISNFILMIIIIICNQEKWSWIASQIVNTLIIIIEYYIIESKQETFKKKISYILTAFPLLLMIHGYLMLNIRSLAIIFYIMFLFVLSLILHLTKALSLIHFCLQYEHCNVNKYKSFFKVFFWFLFQLFIYFKFRGNHFLDQYTRKYEIFNLYSLAQIIQIFILHYLDIRFNPQNENTNYRMIMHVCFISSSIYFLKVFTWLKKYLFEGPFCRNIEIDCNKTMQLSMNSIKENILNFKKKQRNIKIRIINFNQLEFERLFQFLIKQNIVLWIYAKQQGNNGNKFDSFQTFNKKVISIQLETEQFASSLLRIVSENIQPNCKYKIQIGNFQIQSAVFYQILLNYQLIPNLIIHSQLYNPTIMQYVNEIRKIIVFNKLINIYMDHSPLQIYYDLFDT